VIVLALVSGGCASSATPLDTPSSPSEGATRSSSPVATASSSAVASPSSSAKAAAFSLGHFPDPPTKPFSDSTAAALQDVLDAAVESRLPGVTATVLAADRGAWSGAAGNGDESHAMGTEWQFGLASLRKTVIAAEVMRLAEEGLLRLTDPVSALLPSDFDFDTNGATVENLLAMESGIPDSDLADGPQMQIDPLFECSHQREILAGVPSRRSKPGEQFVYEDSNHLLLGLIIEEETGLSLAMALRANVLADSRLTTMVYRPEEQAKGPLAAPSHDPSGCMAGDSGALALWGYQLFGGELLSDRSLAAMTDFGTGTDYDRYGLGVFELTNIGAGYGVTAVGNGGAGAHSTNLAILPTEGVVISVLANRDGDPRELVVPVSQQLAAVLERAP